MSDIKNVIVVGASGNLGPSILQAILASRKFNVSILKWSGGTHSSSSYPANIPVITTDYSPASLEAAFKGQDAVVSVIAGAALGEQKKLIDAAVASGVKRFIPSEFGSNTENKEAQELVPVFSRKVEIKEYLERNKDRGLTWTGLVVGPVFDRSLKLGFLGFDIPSRRATIYDKGDRRFTASTLAQVASAVVGILLNPVETANKFMYIGSFTTSQTEILQVLKSILGDWTVEQASSADLVDIGREKVKRRDSTAIRPLVTAAMYHEKSGSDYEAELGLSNDLLGLTKEDLEQVIKETVKEFSL
ncbi:hypothetical protein H072_9275 [Dactylellina haptotyla CBS 200.50]|uniref:NmrA-like domain-containing protein n=1 Tax=Dactylellina haptotyla (strain CBS 200.50) TaxID=1284197 RepID=S8A311_DACHA|nr:hypothetical protein H072_9275 [Dactylellina haptotyla CBS 200.50]